MTYVDVVQAWGCQENGVCGNLISDGWCLTLDKSAIAHHQPEWKRVRIARPTHKTSKIVTRVKFFCHTVGFTCVGEPTMGELERKLAWQDQ